MTIVHHTVSRGTLRHPEEDIEPRTVYVTNVHFAATKEALSNHFAKCGLVVNVVILTDETIAQPKRSAFITFASVESVNKALALSGTSFFSRTVKVFRKADMATGKSAPPQDAGMPVQARFTHIKGKIAVDRPLYSTPHLQWRRESIPTPSEPSASANIQEKSPSESSASANIQKKSTAGSGSQQPFPS
uniref:RRM domain-containing protein n=1 Tax=Vitis vinifera TaxID=29760 RepID=F6H2W6_VITVI